MAGKPPRIETQQDRTKRFDPETFNVIRTEVAPKVGGNVNDAVKLTADHFKANDQNDLSAVAPDEVRDAMEPILASHVSQAEEEDEGREDVRTRLSKAAIEEFEMKDASRWNRKFRVGDLIAWLGTKGYNEKNLAGPEVVDEFVAETEKLVDRQVDGPENSVCALVTAGLVVRVVDDTGKEQNVEVKCISASGFAFTPVSEHIVLPDRSVLKHASGPLEGKPVRKGSYMVPPNQMLPPGTTVRKIGPVCPRCAGFLHKRSGGAIRFFDSARADDIVAGAEARKAASQGLEALAEGARRHRPPVQQPGTNKGADNRWQPRRRRGN